MAIIEVRGLRKTYGATVAVDGLDLEIEAGEIFGILGPNGSGSSAGSSASGSESQTGTT
ncbi:hypothetical protein [Microbacterium immunditiarum]|uniref:ABC-type multidrug transport system ATPase subunit n=1 Tax=Microbacterium immunditiarum TaxID=337480 RepID=A0A7Y9GSE4_9MICO|nr:ABC-type multidrug transport system ATPase subunit [Microbacterium immunditiarum]